MGCTHHGVPVRALLWIPIQSIQEVTQGNPLPPIIFNMVLYAVICYWLKSVVGDEEVTEGFWRVLKILAVIFYVDYRLQYSPKVTQDTGGRVRPDGPLRPVRTE